MKQLKIAIAALALLAGISLGSCNAQDFSPSVRVGYEFINAMTMSTHAPQNVITSNNTLYSGFAITVDADIWKLSNRCSLGGHLGYSPSSYIKPYDSSMQNLSGDLVECPGLHYGIDLHFSILPNNKMLNICINGSLGSYWAPYISPQVEYGASISATFYPFEHWGVFAETGWGKYFYTSSFPQIYQGHTMARAGVSYRF